MRNRKFLATFSLSVLVAAATVFCSIPVQAAELSQAKSAAQIKYGTVSASDQALLKGMFDYEYYKKTNPDVVAAFGEDANALFNHFLLCGLFEGRCASAAFNPSAYASAYTDLQAAFGTDILSYYRHFALFGANEARPITTLKAAAEAGITVTSLADSNVVITPAIYKLAEKTGNTDLASLQAIATSATKATASSGGGSSSTPSYSGGGSSSSSSSSGSSEEAEPVAVSSVALNMSSTNIKVGTTKKLSATVEPSDATDKSVTWSSDNGETVTVAEDGTITAVAVGGPVTITVTTTDGSKTATCAVTVVDEEVAATGVSLNKSTSTLKVGGTEPLVATVTPSNSTEDVVWSTSDSTKATVLNGKVTAVAEATDPVTISATVGEFHSECAYTISAPDISTVAIDGSSLSVAKGSSLNLTATVTTDPAGAPASYKAVKWSISEAPGISINETTGELSVTNDAAATSVEVTATSTIDDTKSASKTVSITEPPIAAEDITLDKYELTVAKNATSEALVATLLPAGANSAITWETSDDTVATVSNGVVTGIGAGEANIVAISGDVSSGACVVTVPGIKVNSTADQLKITKAGDADANTVTIDAGAYGGGELTWTIKSGSEDKITLEDGVVSLKEGYTTTGESTATVVGSTTPTDSDTAITIDVNITITISE